MLLGIYRTLVETGRSWNPNVQRSICRARKARKLVLELTFTLHQRIQLDPRPSWAWLIATWPGPTGALRLSLLDWCCLLGIFHNLLGLDRTFLETQADLNQFRLICTRDVCIL